VPYPGGVCLERGHRYLPEGKIDMVSVRSI
jgi:hypothetical protein